MNDKKVLLDTNICIYSLKDFEPYKGLLKGDDFLISIITEIELLSFKANDLKEMMKLRGFVDNCNVIGLTNDIKELTIKLRQNYNIKTPDAVILATSITENAQLLTNDEKLKKIYEDRCENGRKTLSDIDR